MASLFGRTNQEYPRVWLAPQLPPKDSLDDLAQAVIEANTLVDPSSSYSLWGEVLRGQPVPFIAAIGTEVERAVDTDHAAGLVQASLLSILSSLGRDQLDFLFFVVRRGLEEHQINGVLEAFELAREEGLVKYFGLSARGPGLAVLGFWQFHDAFEALMLPRHPGSDAYPMLRSTADARRTAICVCEPLTWGRAEPITSRPEVALAAKEAGVDAGQALIAWQAKDNAVLVGVRSQKEVELATGWQGALTGSESVYQAAVESKII